MGKLSIPTLNTFKRLPALSLLVATPLVAGSQTTGDSTITRALHEYELIEHKKDSVAQHMVDSIFQALKPLYLSLYEPDLAQSRIVSKRCTITQKAIEEILLERDPSMLHRGEYVHAKKGPSTILVKKQLDDPSVIAHTLEHEMFHIQRRDWLRKNKKIYNKLPIEAMKTSYFKKAILLYLNETKKGIMKPNLDFYYGEITRSNIGEGCVDSITVIYPVIGDSSDIIKLEGRIKKIESGSFEFPEDELDEISYVVQNISHFMDYIGSEREIYARGRTLQSYLERKTHEQILTPDHIKQLQGNTEYKDNDFLLFIEGFEEEIVSYIKTIAPSR